MVLPISKTQMELAIRGLERHAAELNNVALFRGIPSSEFDKEHLVMLCNLFASEHYKAQQKYFEALDGSFPNYPTDGCVTEDLIQKLREARKKTIWKKPLQPTLWRKIWNKIKDLV